MKLEVTGILFQNSTSQAQCQLQKGAATAIDTSQPWFWLRHDNDSIGRGFSGHRILAVSQSDNPPLVLQGQVFRLVCSSPGGQTMRSVHMTATYYASDYAPITLSILPDTPPQQ